MVSRFWKGLKDYKDIPLRTFGEIIAWVYFARRQVDTYRIICRMLEEKGSLTDLEASQVRDELHRSFEPEISGLDALLRKQEEESRAILRLKEEAEYYQKALKVLGIDK